MTLKICFALAACIVAAAASGEAGTTPLDDDRRSVDSKMSRKSDQFFHSDGRPQDWENTRPRPTAPRCNRIQRPSRTYSGELSGNRIERLRERHRKKIYPKTPGFAASCPPISLPPIPALSQRQIGVITQQPRARRCSDVVKNPPRSPHEAAYMCKLDQNYGGALEVLAKLDQIIAGKEVPSSARAPTSMEARERERLDSQSDARWARVNALRLKKADKKAVKRRKSTKTSGRKAESAPAATLHRLTEKRQRQLKRTEARNADSLQKAKANLAEAREQLTLYRKSTNSGRKKNTAGRRLVVMERLLEEIRAAQAA